MVGVGRAAIVGAGALLLLAGPVATAGATPAGPSPSGCSSAEPARCRITATASIPDMGNGGYRSVHTDVHLVYDAPSNTFRPGTYVALTDRATHACPTSASTSSATPCSAPTGLIWPSAPSPSTGCPRATRSCSRPIRATRRGRNDPDPRAHEAGQTPGRRAGAQPAAAGLLAAVDGATDDGQDGAALPGDRARHHAGAADSAPAPRSWSLSTHTGRPVLHLDGDDSTEGWFASDDPAGTAGFGTAEPSARWNWMPLSNHPTPARPTTLPHRQHRQDRRWPTGPVSSTHSRPSAQFPGAGSTTWHWRWRRRWPVTWSRTAWQLRARRTASGERDAVLPGQRALSPGREGRQPGNHVQQQTHRVPEPVQRPPSRSPPTAC